MKKVILSVLIVGSLLATSCKKAKEGAKSVKETTETVVNKTAEGVETATEVANQAVKSAESLVAGIEVPSFNNEEVDNYVKSFAEYAKAYIDAKGDVLKGDLSKKGQELASKASGVISKLNADDAKKLSDFMTGLQAKMVESTKK